MQRIRLIVRARSDRVRFIVGHDKSLLLCLAGSLLGFGTMLPVVAGISLSLLILGLGMTAVIRAVHRARRPWAAHDFVAATTPLLVADLPSPSCYPGAVYLPVPQRGTGLICEAIDRTLVEHDLRFTVADKPYRLPSRLRTAAPYVLPRSSRRRVVFNGTVIGLRGDPLATTCALTLHHTRFYDLLCSNDICKYKITDRATGAESDLRRELLTGADGRLRMLGESELSDPIGVSTVAITSDGVLILVRQSKHNLSSAGLLAPSGSGSLEPRDIDGTESLQTAVRRCMERELREETGLRADHVAVTKVVGFARWMDRGGKPEFFGLTSIAATADTLRLAKPAGEERLFSSTIHRVPIDLDALHRELEQGTELLEAPSLPEQIRDQGALPLLLAVRAAAMQVQAKYGSGLAEPIHCG